MKIRQRADGRLDIVNNDRRLGRWFLAGTLACLGLAAFHWFQGPSHWDPFVGSMGGSAVFLLAFLALFERSAFVFDPQRRMIDWSRRGLFSRAGGRIPFDDVISVFAEPSMDSDNNFTRRIVLQTGKGDVPITTAYTGDPDGECVRVAARLAKLLGLAASDSTTNSVLSLLRRGREIDAVRMVRADRGISLTEAKDVVDRLRRQMSD